MMVMVLREFMVLMGLALARVMAASDGASLGKLPALAQRPSLPLGGLTRDGVAGRQPNLAIIGRSRLFRLCKSIFVPTPSLRTFRVLSCEQNMLS